MLNRYFEASEDNIDFMYANIAVKNIYFALISLDYIFNHPDFDIGIYHDEHTFYFFHIQSLLTACGNITNVFYNYSGSNGRQVTARCKRLRDSLNIRKTDFPLIFQKEVRNTNEHFDERYEQFHGALGDYNILSENTDPYMRAVIQTNPHLRTYDKESGVYYTYNRKMERIEYSLRDLKDELWRMLDVITENPVFLSAWTDSLPTESIK